MINMQETIEQFGKFPSASKAQQIESLVEGVNIDYGYNSSVSGEQHEILLQEDAEPNNPF